MNDEHHQETSQAPETPAIWRVANALAAVAMVWAVWCVIAGTTAYTEAFTNGATAFMHGDEKIWEISHASIARNMAIALSIIYGLWFLVTGANGPGKAMLAWRAFIKMVAHPTKPELSSAERAAALNCAVKCFFSPLMTFFFVGNCAHFYNAAYNTVTQWGAMPFPELYWRHFHWAAFWGILMLDVVWFFIGYLVEHRSLDNTIRTVEPTALGWFVCIVCYPPQVGWTTDLLGWYASDMPVVVYQFCDSNILSLETGYILTMMVGIPVLILMGVYSYASVAMGLKASNLTNRGTVERGPYALVRHPAYICKTSAWNLSAMVPLSRAIYDQDIQWGAAILFSIIVWTFIYHVRALTEERHLSADPDYRAYCERVKWRYIPGVY
ncbi:conserved membrane hypothetical protein [Gammaproteobacteria bacterium]